MNESKTFIIVLEYLLSTLFNLELKKLFKKILVLINVLNKKNNKFQIITL